jgi:hypothetical protein
MTDDLDTRARTGATALRDAVRDLPVPASHRVRTPHRGRLVLVAAAVVALVALTASLVGRGEDEQRLSTDPSAGAPRLVLDPAPAGMAVSGAVDLPLPGEPSAQGAYWVYGDAGSDDPFADRDLALIHATSSEDTPIPTDGSERTEVDGHTAWVSPPPEDPGDLGRRSVYVEVADGSLGLFSRTLSDTELLAAAGDLDLDAVPLDPPDRLGDLDQVGTTRGSLSAGATLLPFAVGAGHVVGYVDDASDGGRGIYLASVEGGDGALAIARWALGTTIRAVDVDGTEGWSGSPYGEGSSLVVWQESAGVVVGVTGFGIEEAALLAAAESVRIATDAEWEALVRLGDTATVPRDAQLGVSNDDVAGSGFAAYLDDEGYLCVDYAEETGGSVGSCSGGVGESSLTVEALRLSSGQMVLYGYTTLGTDGEIRIEAGDGALVDASEAYHEGGTLFAGLFTDDSLPTEIVVRGADGAELARAGVARPDAGEGSVGFSGEGTATTIGPG